MSIREQDLVDRAELYEQASADQMAFHMGKIRELPDTEYAHQMVFADGELSLNAVLTFCWWHWHGERIEELKSAISGGSFGDHLR